MRRDYTKIRFIIFLILTSGVVGISALAPVLTPFDPYGQNLQEALRAPDTIHLLGTDRYGRDMLSRVLMGGRTTIISTLLLVMIIAVAGTAVGIFCGFYGGRLDSIVMRISDVFLAFPGMVFAIAVAGILGGGITSAVIALAVISWPKYARLARGEVMSIKNRPFMEAARIGGCGTWKLVVNHILPNISGTILITATLDIGTMMMELAGLSFLGLGAMPPTAEWGSMMSEGRSMLQTSPWVILAPGTAIFITVACFNLLGDTIRDLLDPKRTPNPDRRIKKEIPIWPYRKRED